MASNSSDLPLRLLPEDVVFWQSTLLQIAVDAVFYGMQAAIFVAAMIASARQERPARFITTVIVILFISSTTGIVTDILFYVYNTPVIMDRDPAASEATFLALVILTQICTRYNVLVSDAIVVWRAWILSRDSRLAKAALSLCMIGSVAGVITECVWWARDRTVTNGVVTRTLIMDIPLLSTNVVATVLVGMRVWTYRRDIKVHIGPWKSKTRVERALILLLESGFVYCIIWIASMAIDITMGTGNLYAYRAIGISYHSIAGIYPTLIALVVALQRSAASSVLLSTQVSRPMVFAEGEGKQEQSGRDTNFQDSTSESAQSSSAVDVEQPVGPVTAIAHSTSLQGDVYKDAEVETGGSGIAETHGDPPCVQEGK
ncbi:hypothetical protein GGF50DRAFT_127735 [Schizophyllum commune]